MPTRQQLRKLLPPLPAVPRDNLIADYRFDEGSGQVVNNRVYPPAPTINLFAIPEQAFAGSLQWSTAFTVTEYVGTDPFGNNNATRIVSASGAKNLLQTVTLAATAYTVSLWVKSNTGSPQTMRMTLDNTATFSTDITVPTTWTRISYTKTVSAGSTGRGFTTDSVASALDILIYGAQLELGSVASTYQPSIGHLILGKSGASDANDPSWLARGLNFAGGAFYANGQLSVPVSTNRITLYLACRWTGTLNDPTTAYLFNEVVATNNFELGACITTRNNPRFVFKSGSLDCWMTDLNDTLAHVVTAMYDGVALRLYLDGLEVEALLASSLAAINIRQLFASNIVLRRYFPGDIDYIALYSVAHTPVTVRQVVGTLRTILAARSVTIPAIANYVVIEGDSITDPGVAPSGGYGFLNVSPFIGKARLRNMALNGSNLANMTSRAAQLDALYSPQNAKNILSILIGRNDLVNVSYTAAQYVADLKTYCLARKAVGWKIILCTELPSTAAVTGGYNTKRNAVNTLIYGDTSYYDGLADFAADPTMGPDAAASDISLYSDGTHPTALGHTTLKPVWQAALAALV